MKELIGVASNVYFTLDTDTGELVPQTELILMVSEPRWIARKGGISPRRNEIETFRLVAAQKPLAMLVKAILENYDEVKRQMEIIRTQEAARGAETQTAEEK